MAGKTKSAFTFVLFGSMLFLNDHDGSHSFVTDSHRGQNVVCIGLYQSCQRVKDKKKMQIHLSLAAVFHNFLPA